MTGLSGLKLEVSRETPQEHYIGDGAVSQISCTYGEFGTDWALVDSSVTTFRDHASALVTLRKTLAAEKKDAEDPNSPGEGEVKETQDGFVALATESDAASGAAAYVSGDKMVGLTVLVYDKAHGQFDSDAFVSTFDGVSSRLK